MSSDWKLQYIMLRKNTEKGFQWLGICYFPGLLDCFILRCLLRLKHTRVFLFSHGFNWMSISNNSLRMVLYFSKSHKYAAHCCSNCFHIVHSLVPLEALADFLFLIKGFVYKRETNFPFQWSESLFHFHTVVWWGWLVGLSSLRRSWENPTAETLPWNCADFMTTKLLSVKLVYFSCPQATRHPACFVIRIHAASAPFEALERQY